MTIRTFKELFGNCHESPAFYRHGINRHPVVLEHFSLAEKEENTLKSEDKSSLDLSRCLIVQIKDGESKGKIARITRWNGSNATLEILEDGNKVSLSLDKRHICLHSADNLHDIVELIPMCDVSLIRKSQ